MEALMKNTIKNILLCTASVIFCFIAIEIGYRVLIRTQAYLNKKKQTQAAIKKTHPQATIKKSKTEKTETKTTKNASVEQENNTFKNMTHVQRSNYVYQDTNRDEHIKNSALFHFRYYNYFLFGPTPLKTSTLNFANSFASPRISPESVAVNEADEIIWIFGGSTVLQSFMPDELTLANNIAKKLNAIEKKTHIKNFGTDAFQFTTELTKFQQCLRRYNKKEWPTTVIFYHGFNDSIVSYGGAPTAIGFDLSKNVDLLVSRKWKELLNYSLINVIKETTILQNRSLIVNKIKAILVNILEKKKSPSKLNEQTRQMQKQSAKKKSKEKPKEIHKINIQANARRGAEIYELNAEIAKSIGDKFNINVVLVLQPTLATKKNPTAFEKTFLPNMASDLPDFINYYYSYINEKLKDRSLLLDLSSALDNSPDNDFYDACHMGPWAPKKIAAKIVEHLENKKEASLT